MNQQFLKETAIWLESHPVSVDLLKWGLLAVAAWSTGLFSFLKRINQRPKVEVYGPSGFCYLEEKKHEPTGRIGHLAVFVLNPVIKNPSDRSFAIDRFYLGYDCSTILRRFRQNLFHTSFPGRPRKHFGKGTKFLPIFFTKFGDEFDNTLTVLGEIGPKSISAAYVMFISNTWGSWAAREVDGHVEVKLIMTTVGEGILTQKVRLRVQRDRLFLENFCPGIYDYVASEDLWNMERS